MLVAFLREETAKVGSLRRAVVGLSGGIDSAAVAALAAEAFGPPNVLAVHTPYRTSGEDSRRDARDLAQQLGIGFRVIPITAQVDAYRELVGGDVHQVRLGNKMARERKSIEFDLAWPDGAVLGTSNKTELLLGYGTWFGDMASSLNPVGDLYKTQLRELAVLLGIPGRIVRKAPTAELWPGQTDEEELGFSYAQADLVLYHMVDRRLRPDELVQAGFDAALVHRIREMVRKSHFKRVMPLIAKVSLRTVGHDFLYPRDWEAD